MWDGHFTNISVETRIQSSYMDGKMSIPHCFYHLLGAKPKHPCVGALVAPQSVDEIAPPSQIPGLNLTQFNNICNFRPNVAQHIPRPSTRACRARNLFN